ncbi:hypothetical protein EWM64_g6452 [Hericium alpestre]|uniref:Uncharacterized protein n=1 Tax=Hericium alpestre TaxID=135208 RepID=A0A4Y9ZVQ3_9AGAM|nr:hypothetical protein EWM64_g6452 [Hericium alpestre]
MSSIDSQLEHGPDRIAAPQGNDGDVALATATDLCDRQVRRSTASLRTTTSSASPTVVATPLRRVTSRALSCGAITWQNYETAEAVSAIHGNPRRAQLRALTSLDLAKAARPPIASPPSILSI